LSNQQIADRVSLSVPTIKWRFFNLYAKLLVRSRAAALAKAGSLLLSR
jgi:LuxR family maltose regulon positive regulatory protein